MERPRIALVTGGSSGIGLATCRRFAADGYRLIVISDRALDSYADTIAELRPQAGAIWAYRCDISDRAAINRTVDSAVAIAGGLDICVNSAGISVSDPLGGGDPADFDRMMAVNVTGTYNMLRVAVRAMRAGGGGAIVNIASTAGLLGVHNMIGYSASKAAILSMTRTLPGELRGQNIWVNAIAPAAVATAMTAGLQAPRTDAEKRARAHVEALTPSPDGNVVLSAETIADMVAFLVSPAAAGMTGSVLTADFGLTSSIGLFPSA